MIIMMILNMPTSYFTKKNGFTTLWIISNDETELKVRYYVRNI
jgi:hypothetical protein